MNRRTIKQVLLYYQTFCQSPLSPSMSVEQCALVIHTALHYCAHVEDPRGLSPQTIHKVLESSGFKLEPLPTPVETPMATVIT